MMKRGICLIITLFSLNSLFAQYESIQEDVEKGKPEKYQNRTLKSEKTGEKKFGVKRRFIQNTVTHYNYYFNASNKLQAVIDRARAANKENYLDLLPFYDYTLKNTSLQKVELDSVIYRATAGILLHDLRNNWVDDLYMIIGEAYFFKNDMDSASMTFQFINYNLMPKGKDEDVGNVGSTNDKSTDISIANKERKGWSKKPIRNDALIWQIRTLIEQEQYPEAAGLITTLQNDQNFPNRLRNDLEEVNAYWFYQQMMYDSSAIHLEKALSAAENKQGKARMQFLLAQLYEISRQPEKAAIYYTKAAKNTNDPLMDIYSNLNSAKMYKGNAGKDLDNNISQLVHMSKKDKYESFKDVVYYSAGELALKKPDTAQAIGFYKKSTTFNTSNAAVKNKAFLQLGNIAYYRKDYKNAASYYDSLQLSDPVLMNDAKVIQERKDALVQIVSKIGTIEREDSLQRIAAMPASDREKFVRAILKKIRKELGLKEEGGSGGNATGTFGQITSGDIFGDQNSSGEWYFYNASTKGRGYNDFKTKWGKRSNVDNWRRNAGAQVINVSPDDISDTKSGQNTKSNPNPQPDETTYEGLMSHVPLTTDQMNLSNTNLSAATFELGNLYLNLEEYSLATQQYESSLKRYPDSLYDGQLYLNAMYAYQKLGDQSKSNYYKNLLTTKFKNTKYADAILNPNKPKNEKDLAATKGYEQVYSLFIEGNFEQALKEKKVADALYGKTYWTPQLLYIEAVYYIKQKQDSQAISVLTNIANLYPTSPLRPKALTLIDVLKRRKSIETYLSNLNVTRKTDSITVVANNPVNNNVPANDNKNKGNEIKKENKVPDLGIPNVNDGTPVFSFDANTPMLVVMVLDKVDPVYITEVKNAFNRYDRSKYAAKNIAIADAALDKDKSLLLFTPFTNADDAITYIQSLKTEASSQITWLPANKYSYILISESNLNLLKTNKNLKAYTDLLHSKYPEKF